MVCETLEYRLLDTFIIHEKNKEEKKREEGRPQLEVPVPDYAPMPKKEGEQPKRGVERIVIFPGEEDSDYK